MLRCLFFTTILAIQAIFNPVLAAEPLTKRTDVQQFINKMVKKHKFKKDQLEKLFAQVKIRPKVMEHIQKPLEAKPWSTYQRLFVDERRIKNGVKFWQKHAKTLADAQKKYGVAPSIIVATLGVETRYGKRTGGFRVIDSLSSIGFSKSHRAGFFRKELEQFLLLTREQHLDPLKVTGSYAGAIGVPQFMPSSYRHYAIDYTKNGSADLMDNIDDVIASVANYYKRNGWVKGGPIAVKADVNVKEYNKYKKTLKRKKSVPLKTLEKHGVKPDSKEKFANKKAKVIELPVKSGNEYWIGFHNFEVIRRYNPNDLYAMAVYQLSDYIKALKDRK